MRVLPLLISLLLINLIIAADSDIQAQLSVQQKNTINKEEKERSFLSQMFKSFKFNKQSPKKQEVIVKDQSKNDNQLFKKLDLQNGMSRPNMAESFLFNQMQKSLLNRVTKGSELPYEALLPRRRMPLQVGQLKINSPFLNSERTNQQNPLEDLVKILENNERQQTETVNWQNPNFKDKKRGSQLPFSKIFGKKNKKKHEQRYIKQSQIQPLLIAQIPFLEGGRIVDMTSNHYRKGTFLNIEFQTKQNKLYTIIARYKLKSQRLQIISLKQNTSVMKQAQEEINEQLSEQNSVKQESNKVKEQKFVQSSSTESPKLITGDMTINKQVKNSIDVTKEQKKSQIKGENQKETQKKQQVQKKEINESLVKKSIKPSQKKQAQKSQITEVPEKNKEKSQNQIKQSPKPKEQKIESVSNQQKKKNLSEGNTDNIVKQ